MSVSEFDAWKKQKDKHEAQNQQGPKVGDYSLLQEAPRALGRGVANLVGGFADFLDMNSQVSGLHGPASSPSVEVTKEQLNAPGVLNDIGNYAAQKQQDWKKTTTTGKGLGDLMNGDASYITSGEIFGDTLESAPTMLPGVAIGALGGPQAAPLAVALATGGSQAAAEAGNTYRDLRKKGYDPERAKEAAMGDFYTKALLYTAGDVATAGAVRMGGSKTLGKLIGPNKEKASAILKKAEEYAAKHPTLDKYGRPLASWAGGVASEMNETATETKLGDVWENYAKTGNVNVGDILQAYNPAYQTDESLKGAIQTIGPAGILVGGGMAVKRKRGDGKAETAGETKANAEQPAQEQISIPESAEERTKLANDLQEQNAQASKRIQELQNELPANPDLDNLSVEQLSKLEELETLNTQVAQNEVTLAQLRENGVNTQSIAQEQSGPRTVEQINSEISDIEARQRNADAEELADLARQRQALINERNSVEQDNAIQNADLQSLQKQDKALNTEYGKIVKQINTAQDNIAKLDPKKKGYQKALAAAQKKIKALWEMQDKIQEQRNAIAERMAAIEEANKPKPAETVQPQQPLVNEQEQLRQQNENAQNYYEQQGQQARDEAWYAMERERAAANGQTQDENVVSETDRLLAENQNVQDNLNTANAKIEYDENIPPKERLQAIRQQRNEVIGRKSNAIESQRQEQQARSQAAEQAVLGNKPNPETSSQEQSNNSETLTQHDHFIYRAIKKLFDDNSVITMFKSPKQYYDSNPLLPNWDTLNISQRQRANDDFVAARNNEVIVPPKTANIEELQRLADKGYLKIVRGIKRNGEQCQLVKLLKNEAGDLLTKPAETTDAQPRRKESRAKGTREEQKARREERRNKPRKTYPETTAQPVVEEKPAPEQVVAEEEKPVQNPNEDIRPENIFQDGDDYVDLSKLSDEELEALWRKKEKELLESIDNAFKYKEEHKNDADFKEKYRELLRANNRKMQDQGPILDEMNRREEAKRGNAAQSEKQNIGEKLKEKLEEANRDFKETINEVEKQHPTKPAETSEKKENVSRATPQETNQIKALEEKKKNLEKERSNILAEQKRLAEKEKTATGEALEKIRKERKRLNDRFKQAGTEYENVLKAIKEAEENGTNSKTGNQNEGTKPKENQNSKAETKSKNGEAQEDLDAGEAGIMRRYKTVDKYWNNHHKEKWSSLSDFQKAKIKAQFEAAHAQGKASAVSTNENTQNATTTAEEQMQAVREKYEGTDQWLKAPNGKPTKLTEKQWLQVRTPSFKEWFGDWENDPDNASQILDENGEPLAVYHGTPTAEFETFNTDATYTTADKEVAKYYSNHSDDIISKRNSYIDLNIHKKSLNDVLQFIKDQIGEKYHEYKTNFADLVKKTFSTTDDDLADFFGGNGSDFNANDRLEWLNDHIDDSLEGWQKTIYDAVEEYQNLSQKAREGNITEAQARRMVELEKQVREIRKEYGAAARKFLRGAEIGELHKQNPELRTDEKLYVSEGKDATPVTETELRAKAKEVAQNKAAKGLIPLFVNMKNPFIYDGKGQDWKRLSLAEYTNGEIDYDVTTDDIVKWAKKQGYDGVIFKNVFDSDAHSADEFVTFEPNQLKSSTENNGNFSKENNSIYYSASEKTSTDRGVERVINEAKKAFKGCKFERDGNALLVTLPNGKKFFIDVKRKIVLSSNQEADARAAHNLNGDMNVEGNWTALSGDDIVGFLELATNGREGTAYHEALHAAMDLVLTTDEKDALMKHFKKVAKQKGINVEEAIADGYKDWVLAKQQGKGAPFGRLFQKMKDFAEKMGKVLMGEKDFKKAMGEIVSETNEEIAKFKSRNIFAEIENGEVWKRGGNLIDADGKTKYLVTNPDIDEKTRAYVVDITDTEMATLSNKTEIANAMQKAMKERDFKLGESGAVVVLPEKKREKEHYVRSYNDEQVGDSTRLKAVTAIENLLTNAVYVDRHDDHSHFRDRKYVEAYVPVRNGKHVYSMRITLRDTVNGDTLKISKVELYNIEKKQPINSKDIKMGLNGEYVEIGAILNGNKDTYATPGSNGKPVNQNRNYMENGKPVYTSEAQETRNQRQAAARAKAEAAEKARLEAETKAKEEERLAKESKKQNYANKMQRKLEQTRARAKGQKGRASAVRNDTAEGRGAQVVHRDTSNLPTWDKLGKMWNTVYEGWFDKLDPLNRLQKRIENAAGQTLEFSKNVYKNTRLARSNAASRSKMLVMGMKGATSKQVIKAINDTMKNVKLKYDVTLNDVLNVIDSNKMDELYPDYLDQGAFENWQHALETYFVARRQIEIQMAEPGYIGPMNAKDAFAIVRNAPAEFKEASKLYSQYNDNLLTILEDAGLITEAEHEALTKAGKNYSPMQRDFTDENGKDLLDDLFSAIGGKGVGNVKSGLKKLSKWGSDRAVLSPLETTVMNTYAILNRAERNKVGQIFADLKDLDVDGDFISEVGRGKKAKADPDKNTFVVMENGEKVAYKIAPEFYNAVVSVNEDGGDFLAKYARGMAQALRTGATISPDFMLANVFRDTFHASVASENGFKPIWDTIRGAYKLKTDAQFAAEFESAGVPMTGLIGANRRNALDTLNKMAGNDKWKTTNPIKLGKAICETVYDALQDLGELAESGTRAGEYLLAKENGKTIAEAAFAAKEITVDFSRSGKYGQKANQVIPFFNAVLQGGDRLARLYADPQTRTRAVMNTIKYIVLPSVALWACNHDKEWYKDLPEDVKNGNWCFKMGDTIIRLPKPQEAGVLFGSSIERMLDYAAEKDAKLTGDFAKYVLKDVVLPNFVPTVLGPLLEWKTGVSMWTYKPVVGQRYQRLTPEKQYNAHTTQIAKAIGSNKAVIALGGSPMKVDNAIRGLWGGAGTFIAGSMDVFFGKEYERPAKDIADLPGVRRFTYQDGRRTQSTNDFFELYDRAVKYHNSYNKGKSDPVYSALVKTNKKLSELNTEIENIYTSKTMSPEAKKEQIKAKEKLYSNYARKAVAVYKDKVK